MKQGKDNRKRNRDAGQWSGISQLSIVEHSLCRLDPPSGPFIHQTEYAYFVAGKKRTAHPELHCGLGLKPEDEFYLWGVCGLVFSQSEPEINLYASARYVLRYLGLSEGGPAVSNLRAALHRLAGCRYKNPNFYDPVRGEYRDVDFGFVSLDLPRRDKSSRPWRISLDPVFFDFCKAAGGFLAFDLDLYRELRPASRRLFLLLKKLFYKGKGVTHYYKVEDLAVNVLGFAPNQSAAEYNKKVFGCAKDLAKLELVTLPAGGQSAICEKLRKGVYQVRFTRGPHFDKKAETRKPLPADQQARYELLKNIGLNDACIRRVLKECSPDAVIDWADATMMAEERWGSKYFKKSKAAFFWEGVQSGRRPPDWFLEEKRKQEHGDWAKARETLEKCGLKGTAAAPVDTRMERERKFREWLGGDGRAEYARLTRDIFAGNAKEAQIHLRRQFDQEHSPKDEVSRLGDVLRFGRNDN